LGIVLDRLHRAVMEFTTARQVVVSRARGSRVADLMAQRATVFRNVGPNWFASAMGTGIVATAAALLPRQSHALHLFALGVWIGAALLLCLLSAATVLHWFFYSTNARRHLLEPAMAPFFGAPPMAILTVGSGALLVGHSVLGMATAVRLDLALWLLGTVLGLAAAATVPFVMFTRHELRLESTHAGWLMPIVPPMVSAATGAGLIAHLPAGQLRLCLLLACYALFGLSLLAAVITITLVWARLAYHDVGPAHLVPTLWIVLGPLGTSIAAANLLGGAAAGVLPPREVAAFQALGVLYGVAAWGFAMLWLAIVIAITVRTARNHLPFSLTWWSFTFPVGTLVLGTSELASHTGAEPLTWAAVALYVGLVGAWVTVAARTAHGLFVLHRLAPTTDPQAGR
jgi:C4-dicarboxylate transporter/malic acid transport protein